MRTRLLMIFAVGILGIYGTDSFIQNADGHGVGPTLIRPPLVIYDETFDKQFIQISETLTIQGNLTNYSDQDVKGMVSISSNSIDSWDGIEEPQTTEFNIPANSTIEYSHFVRPLELGTYHVHTQFHFDKNNPIIGPGQTISVEPTEPTISDEQEQMMREYCETGIPHPDMIGMPLCVKNELVCGPDSILRDGICHKVITETLPILYEDHSGMGGFILIGIPAIIAIIIISVIGYKKS